MIRFCGFVGILVVAGRLALAPSVTAQTSVAPEQLITGFAAAQNPDAVFYAINRAATAEPAALPKAALAHIGDADA